MFVARLSSEDICHEPKRVRLEWPLVMRFSDEDKIETIQPHDDALVITLRIGEIGRASCRERVCAIV